jgi:hypothetical protein
VSHFLIATALGAAPAGVAGVGDNITQALLLVSQAFRYVANLAISVATYSPPQAQDISGLSSAVKAVLTAINTAQKDALANMDNLGNGTTSPIVIFTANGPEIVNQILYETTVHIRGQVLTLIDS